jgi:hypothetical protein
MLDGNFDRQRTWWSVGFFYLTPFSILFQDIELMTEREVFQDQRTVRPQSRKKSA